LIVAIAKAMIIKAASSCLPQKLLAYSISGVLLRL